MHEVGRAGRYTIARARQIVARAQLGRSFRPEGKDPPPELVVRLEDVEACGVR